MIRPARRRLVPGCGVRRGSASLALLAAVVSGPAPCTAQEAPEPDPYEIDCPSFEVSLTDAARDELVRRLRTIRDEHAGGSLRVVVADAERVWLDDASVVEAFVPGAEGEPKEDEDAEPVLQRRVRLGRVTGAFVSLVAAATLDERGLDVDTPANTLAPALFEDPSAQKLGRPPTLPELLSGMGGVRSMGTSAYERPLFQPEFLGLFNDRPMRRYQPGEGGAAAAMLILARATSSPFPALAASTLADAELPPIDTPRFGQFAAAPDELATIFGSLADRSLVRPSTLADVARLQLGTLDRAMGFQAGRVTDRQAWMLSAHDDDAGLAVRVDLERQIATVVYAPDADDPEAVARRVLAAVEAAIPSPRESGDCPNHDDPRTRARIAFRSVDQDGDGLVTFEEAGIEGTRGAGIGDENADGVLTIDEWATSMGRLQNR
ncbi:MAG: hypothetical protein AAF108_08560 [Planctomycetota bacterium]